MRKLKVIITTNEDFDSAEYGTNKDCEYITKIYYDEDFFSKNFFPAEIHLIDEACEIFIGDLVYRFADKKFIKSGGYYSKDSIIKEGLIAKVVASTLYFDFSINREYINLLFISDSVINEIATKRLPYLYGKTNEDNELLDDGYGNIEVIYPKEYVGFSYNEVDYLLDKALRDFRSDVLPFGEYPDYHIIEFLKKFKENIDEYNYPKN